ncbi:hypothetical protein [Nonlabens sp.]|uniref:hypothetical protein n=1 Tax=Nonlabens sp. TaxID=1888209 RepID=UPI0032664C45
MKNIACFLILVISIQLSRADCSAHELNSYPDQGELLLNSMLIMEGYAMDQKLIMGLEDSYLYLKDSEGFIIDLHLQEILKGQYGLTQAIFYPCKSLQLNENYKLVYSDQNDNNIKVLGKKIGFKNFSWKAVKGKSKKIGDSELEIKFESNSFMDLGCGSAEFACFKILKDDQYIKWYRTEVVNLKTNESSSYYLKSKDATLIVGHGMCAGAFSFEAKTCYKVQFTPVTNQGELLESAEWIEFESPNYANNFF